MLRGLLRPAVLLDMIRFFTVFEKTRSEDLGGYYRVAADGRDLNYDKYFVNGEVRTQAPEDYTSHNTRRLTVDEVVDKLLSLEYVKEELAALGK